MTATKNPMHTRKVLAAQRFLRATEHLPAWAMRMARWIDARGPFWGRENRNQAIRDALSRASSLPKEIWARINCRVREVALVEAFRHAGKDATATASVLMAHALIEKSLNGQVSPSEWVRLVKIAGVAHDEARTSAGRLAASVAQWSASPRGEEADVDGVLSGARGASVASVRNGKRIWAAIAETLVAIVLAFVIVSSFGGEAGNALVLLLSVSAVSAFVVFVRFFVVGHLASTESVSRMANEIAAAINDECEVAERREDRA